MGQPKELYVIKYTRRKTQNLDSLLRQLDKEGKTYADWQKERYRAFYDVKSTIKLDIELMHYDYIERAFDRKQKNDQIQVFKKYGYKTKEGV